MKRLATLYGGSFPEHQVLNDANYRRWFTDVIYVRDLAATDLSPFDGLVVPEGLHHRTLYAAAGQIAAFLESGGTVLLFGDQPAAWLPGLDWEFRVAQAPQPGDLVAHRLDHPFYQYLSLEDAMLHHHGIFHPPADAETLIADAEGSSVLYVDTVSTGGCLMATSMDLFVHVGTFPNPPAARFLDRFLPWVVEELL